jgi:hypothetical protein
MKSRKRNAPDKLSGQAKPVMPNTVIAEIIGLRVAPDLPTRGIL